MQNKSNDNLITFLAIVITVMMILLFCYIRLFEGTWPDLNYFKYVYWFANNHYFTFLGFHIPLPFRFIVAVVASIATALAGLLFFNKYFLVNIKRVNKELSYWAKWSEIKKFKKHGVSVTDKTGVVLGVYNLGLLPHSFFTKLYSSRVKPISLIGRFFLAWSHIPILNIFIRYRILCSSAGLALLCYAPAGTGKTAGVVLPIIWSSNKDNLIINDPKGEIYSKTKDYRKALGSKIIKFEWGSDTSHKWNPLDISNFINLKGTDAYYVKIAEYCNRLGDILIPANSKTSDPFWGDSARGLFIIIALYLVYYRAEQGESTNVLEIKQYCNNMSIPLSEEEEEAIQERKITPIKYKTENMIAFLECEILSNTTSEVAHLSINQIINALRAQAEKEEKQRQTFLQTIEANTKVFSINPRVAINTSSNDVTFDEIRHGFNGKPVTVYMIVPATEQSSYGVISALFVEFMYQSLVAMPEPKKTTPLLRVILDEVAFFPPINAIKDGPAITRSYKIAWNFICQDAGQLKDKWGAEAFQVMRTNAAFQLFLCQNNPGIEKETSEALGFTEVIEIKGTGAHKEKIPVKKPLITPNEVGSLKNKQLIKVQGNSNRPIICNQPLYFRYPEFMNKINALNKVKKVNKSI